MAEPGNVVRLEYEGREIYIIGTAHVSQRSVEEVRRVIDELRPDTVCVELDAMRYEALVDDTRWQKLDIFTVVREKKVLFLLTSLALSAYQRRIGDRLGVRPGSELLAAVESAEAIGAKVVLADRNVQATLKRTWASLSFLDKVKLATGLASAPFAVDEIDEETIEQLKDRDTISDMLNELAKIMPHVKTPLIDERDQYLIAKTRSAPGQKIVSVVGAGHVNGMMARLSEPVDLAALETIPGPSLLTQVLKWLIPAIVLGAFYYGYTQHSGDNFANMLYAWVLPNSIVAALFSIMALAKPLTVLTAFVASPITSLNPTIGAGMVAGLVEAWLRKPTVADCQRIREDVASIRGIYRNPFTRVLIVAIASNIGSALGAWIGAAWVMTLL